MAGYSVVRDPAAGFFIAGSSIAEMNGVYGRTENREDDAYVYRNKYVRH